MQGANFAYLTGDKLVCQGAAYLLGVILDASQDSGAATVYEGQDASSGRIIAKFEALGSVTKTYNLPKPLYCQRGIFVDVGANLTGITIIWERPRKDIIEV